MKIFRYDDDEEDILQNLEKVWSGEKLSLDIETADIGSFVIARPWRTPNWDLLDDKTTDFEPWLNHIIPQVMLAKQGIMFLFKYRGVKFHIEYQADERVHFFAGVDETGTDIELSVFRLIDQMEAKMNNGRSHEGH